MHIISNWYLVKVKAHLEALQVENDHLSREIAILRETVKVNILLNSKRSGTVFNIKEQWLDRWVGGAKQNSLAESFKECLEADTCMCVGLDFWKVACDSLEVGSNDVKGDIKRSERCKRVYIIEIHLRHILNSRISF